MTGSRSKYIPGLKNCNSTVTVSMSNWLEVALVVSNRMRGVQSQSICHSNPYYFQFLQRRNSCPWRHTAPNVLCLTAIARIWVGDQDPKCPWWFCTGYGAPEAKKRWWWGAPDLFVPGTVPLKISDCNFCLKSVPWVRFYFFMAVLESEFQALSI